MKVVGGVGGVPYVDGVYYRDVGCNVVGRFLMKVDRYLRSQA